MHGRGVGASALTCDLIAIRTHDDCIEPDPRMDHALIIVKDGLCDYIRPWRDRLVKDDELYRDVARLVVVVDDTEMHSSEQELPAAHRDSI
jgi:hypothetical protein